VTEQPLRDRYVELALPYIPRLLHLIDRNPYSPTYGCFDRAYWHYRTMDFPCGMSQEFVLPVAQAYARDVPGNRFFGVTRVRELAEAAIRYMKRGSHPDGTCDDYFPYERAMGALVFSLYAGTEAYQILGMDDPEVVEFFVKRVRHLAHQNETGQLANHQALAALAAYNVYLISGDDMCRTVADARVDLTLSWQHQEGWFQEYEGADPGYHTCTIDFLAKLQQKRKDSSLVPPLTRAVEFAWHFMHPDGSYGGEYGSRNTYHFYPHGFELMAPHTEKAGQIADAFLRSSRLGKRYINDDDRMTAHYVYNFLQAYDDYHPHRPVPIAETRAEPSLRWFPGSKIAVYCNGRSGDEHLYAVANLSKGGVVKVFGTSRPVASDTGLIGETGDGTVVVTHLVQHDNPVTANPETGEFTVEGRFCRRKHRLPSPWSVVCFRLLTLTIGRVAPNLVRATLQKILITGKPTVPLRFRRVLRFEPDGVAVQDEIEGSAAFARLSCGSDATSIYVANSNVYQESVLCPWQHADWNALPARADGWRIWRRVYGVTASRAARAETP
jgi:hypothetical protein